MAKSPTSASDVRPGDRVRLIYDCSAALSGVVRENPRGLVLDIPGDHYVVRRPDGSTPEDVVRIEVVDEPR